MKTIKKIYSQNKFIVASTIMLFLCAEIFCNILSYRFRYHGDVELSFFTNIFAEIIYFMCGVIIAFRYGDRFDKKYIPYLCAGSILLSLCCSDSGFIDLYFFDFYAAPISGFITVYFLAQYYINYCTQSLFHNLMYIFAGTVFIIKNAGEIEPYFIFTLQIALFVCLKSSIKDKRIKITNIIHTVVAVMFDCWFIFANVYDYINFEFEEGHIIVRIESVLRTLQPFGKSENFGEIETLISDFDLMRISGYFGYVAGIFVLAVLTVFIVSIFIKAFRNKDRVCVASLAAVSIFGVSYVSSVLMNFGIVFGRIYVGAPILSYGKDSLLITGLLLGLVFADAEKITTKVTENF